MDEKIKFIARLIEGEKMSELCREFGISRKTGYKIKQRYEDVGISAIGNQSRRPLRLANQLPFQIEKVILKMKQERPHWGAPKLRELLIRKYPYMKPPAKSTVHAVLDRHGLVKKRRRKRYKACGTVLGSTHESPNDLWCADYKGEFMLGDRRYCYPLTISDFRSRYLITCEALETTKKGFRVSAT